MSLELAVFGNPISHSLSPCIHQHFASQCCASVPFRYQKLLVEESLEPKVLEFFSKGGQGCNVTVPCKFEAYTLATELTPAAKRAGAVNTLKALRDAEGKLIGIQGDNTDGRGFISDILRLKCPLKQAHVLVIGTGGAAHGITPYLLEQDIASLTLVNRTLAKAQELALELNKEALHPVEAYNFETLPERHYSVVINATSLSLYKELPPLQDMLLQQADFVYDLYYTKTGSTVFTEHAQRLGVKNCYDGLGMLIGQAALSWELWCGQRPDIDATLAYMRTVLEEKK